MYTKLFILVFWTLNVVEDFRPGPITAKIKIEIKVENDAVLCFLIYMLIYDIVIYSCFEILLIVSLWYFTLTFFFQKTTIKQIETCQNISESLLSMWKVKSSEAI